MDANAWTTLGVGILTLVYVAGAGILGYMFWANQREHDALGKIVETLNTKVEGVQAHLGKQDTVLAAVDATVKERVKSTDQRFDAVEAQLRRGIARMDSTADDVTAIGKSMARIEGMLEAQAQAAARHAPDA